MFKHLKITRKFPKKSGTVEEALRNCGAVAACLLHTPPPLAARGFTRHREIQGRGEIRDGFLPSSSSSRPWAAPLPAKHSKTQAKLPVLSFFRSASPSFSLFKSAALSASFFASSSSVSSGRCMTKDCRSGGAAGLLLPLEAVRR